MIGAIVEDCVLWSTLVWKNDISEEILLEQKIVGGSRLVTNLVGQLLCNIAFSK